MVRARMPGERRGKKGERGEGDQKGQTGPAQGTRAVGRRSEVAAMTTFAG